MNRKKKIRGVPKPDRRMDITEGRIEIIASFPCDKRMHTGGSAPFDQMDECLRLNVRTMMPNLEKHLMTCQPCRVQAPLPAPAD